MEDGELELKFSGRKECYRAQERENWRKEY